MKTIMQKLQGFTLIELLVVISIIGILAALLLANFAGIRDRADDARLKNNMKQFQTALRTYYNDNQSYPAAGVCNTRLSSTYINTADVPATNCQYTVGSPADTFKACVSLANSADRDIETAGGRCGGPIAGVTNPFCVCSN